jgi:hypothetical protein
MMSQSERAPGAYQTKPEKRNEDEQTEHYAKFYNIAEDKSRILEPTFALAEFKDRAAEKFTYDQAKQAEHGGTEPVLHGVFSSEELSKLSGSEQINDLTEESDRQLVRDLTEYLGEPRVDQYNNGTEDATTLDTLTKIGEYFIIEAEKANLNHAGIDIEPDSDQSKLRRTAMVVYKALRVPPQRVMTGGFKKVVGPIGINPQVAEVIKSSDAIINGVKHPLYWDGSLKKIEPKVVKESRPEKEFAQWAKINIKTEGDSENDDERYVDEDEEEGLEGAEGETEEKETTPPFIKREFDLEGEVRMIESVLSSIPGCRLVPEVKHALSKETKYLEYLPNTLEMEDLYENASQLHDFAVELKRLWQEGGYVNFDLKFENIRCRADKSAVMIDTESMVKGKAARTIVPVSKIMELPVSPDRVDPEVMEVMKVGGQHVGIDRMMVYQLGAVMLDSIFGPDEVDRVLEKEKIGYIWDSKAWINGRKRRIVAPTVDTLRACWKKNPDRVIPTRMIAILEVALQPYASFRPSLDSLIQQLAKVAAEKETDRGKVYPEIELETDMN